MRKAITDYHMLEDGDCVLVGVSGGKDFMVLLTGLARMHQFLGIDYTIKAVMLDHGFVGVEQDYSAIEEYCRPGRFV